MKRTLLSILFVCGLFTAAISQTTHTITLYVNTAQITNGQEAYLYAYFEGQPEGTDTRDFTTFVSPGDMVVWRGVSLSSEADQVFVEMINYQGGDNLFDTNVLRATQENPGIVTGVIQAGTQGLEEKYVISFRVFNNGTQRNGMYHIDPKLKVRR
jgi:hypothetical protein